MLDNPEKTRELLATLVAAAPFEVELTPEAIELLRTQDPPIVVKSQQIVSTISYAGDEGGIVCHIHPRDAKNAIIISITHVRMNHKQPPAAALFDYQTHRVKKLKKQRHR